MKTKIIKHHGWWRLVVADKAINEKYEQTQEHPIVLASITNFFESGCWSFQNWRLCKHRKPSHYLEESSEDFVYENEDEKNRVLASLHSYSLDEETKVISWPKFDSIDYNGDNPSCLASDGSFVHITARFTFKGALKKLKEQKFFWDSFEGDDLTIASLKLENSYRQTHSSVFYMDRTTQNIKRNKII